MNQSSTSSQTYIFVDVLSLVLGLSLLALGISGLFQVLWEASFLVWFSSLSLAFRYSDRWSGHRLFTWIQRTLAISSLAGLAGIVYLSPWPDSSTFSHVIQGTVLGGWGLLLFLCARFVPKGAHRTRMFFFLWFPLLYAVRIYFPPSKVYIDLAIWGMGMVLLTEGTIRGLWTLYSPKRSSSNHIPQTLLHLFFHRFDPFRSVFSTLQSQLGIDVQGARAIAFVRRSMLPLTGFLILFLWGLSSFVLVHPHEQGVRFRFGEPQEQLLNPGLHLKWPWPWGVIQTVPSSRILSMNIGHEEEEEEDNGEKESILWANQHAEEEFSLLMGDQVNLISVDGTLQYQISDPILYLLSWQNPEAQFKDIAYQVLSRSCAERTLQEALSENLQILAQEVLTEIQQEATEQQLGLLPISFTFSALHPPVSVARDYQGVVSAQIDKESTLIRAHAYRLKSLPRAQIEAQTMSTTAKRDALMRVAKAKGEAEAFRGLYETVYSDRSRYLFQRRLDVLKNNLKGRRMSIIDHTLEQEGATLWIED